VADQCRCVRKRINKCCFFFVSDSRVIVFVRRMNVKVNNIIQHMYHCTHCCLDYVLCLYKYYNYNE